MPVIKSAQKKLRKDKKRTETNKKLKNNFKTAIKKALKSPTQKTVTEAVRLADKAAQKNIIHKNKAARIKSKLTKLINKTGRKTAVSSSKKSPKTVKK